MGRRCSADGRESNGGDSLNGDPCFTRIVSYRDVDGARVKIMYRRHTDTEWQPDDRPDEEDVPDGASGSGRSVVLYSDGQVVNSYDLGGEATIPDIENLRQLLRTFVDEGATAEVLDSVLCAMTRARVVSLDADGDEDFYAESEY